MSAISSMKKNRYVDKIEAMLTLQKPKIAIDHREHVVAKKEKPVRKKILLKDYTYKDFFPYAADEKITEEVIVRVVSKLSDFIKSSNDRTSKVIHYIDPCQLQKEIDFNLKNEGENLQEILCITDKVLKYAVKTGHPRFFNQLFSGLDITCLMGQWISTTTNTLMFTYEVGPVYIMMEKYLLDKMKSIIGYSNGDAQMFPGGSISNMEAMSIAKYHFHPNLKEEGLYGGKQLVAFVSEEAHYSSDKAAATLGIGTNNLKKIKSDEKGKMVVKDLVEQIEASLLRGEEPFFVCATAGTTVLGAFDPINDIADICKKYRLWLHVDGAWGGGSLLSRKYKHLMAGVERGLCDMEPSQANGMFVSMLNSFYKKKDILASCNRESVDGASYLFQKDKRLYNAKEWDQGDKTIQCGRNVDVLKLWLMWKAKGDKGMEEQIDRVFNLSRYLADVIKKRENFKLIMEPQCTNVCFYYYPPSIKKMNDGPEKNAKLHSIAPIIKSRMTLEGTMLCGYQPLKEHVNFWRMTVINPAVTYDDMDFVVNEIERLGKDL